MGETRGSLARLLRTKKQIADALEGCIDSLEYVNRAHPEATGWGVRLERIEKAKAALATLQQR